MICVPIVSSKEALKDIDLASSADIIELRADLLGIGEDSGEKRLEKLISSSKKPVIVTNRKKSEGGNAVDNKKRIELLEKAVQLKADFIDIELSSGKEVINELIKNKKKSKVIVSYHNFKETPKEPKKLNGIYERIKKLNPDIIKIATFANSINDNLTIFDLIKRAKQEGREIIALCMGEKGEISRILSPLFGSYLTFASIKDGKESAHGQISADKLKKVYRIDKLKNPEVFGLVGNPVSHSKGYIIHNKSFGRLGLDKVYVNFLVEDLGRFIEGFKDIFSGLSITIPYKEAIIKYLDEIEPIARKIGAVNTVVKKGGRLVGYNTDYIGAINAIKPKSKIKGKRVAMIGAGGVAKAIAFGVIKEGGKLTIFNRTIEKAKRLAKEVKCEFNWLEQIDNLKGIDILINATSIGMNEDKTPVSKRTLSKIMKQNAVVFDSVYTPPETRLLKDADALGLKTVSGYDMFINQAKEQFKLFTGKDMPNL